MRNVSSSSLFDRATTEICFDDSWSDDEPTQPQRKAAASTSASASGAAAQPVSDLSKASLAALQNQLAQSEAKNKSLQAVLDRLMAAGGNDGQESDSESDSDGEEDVKGKGKGKMEDKKEKKGKGKGKMDIDTHYFDSYASNGQSHAPYVFSMNSRLFDTSQADVRIGRMMGM